MAGERKTLLAVEDCKHTLEEYETSFTEEGYDVTAVFYNGPNTEIPSGSYDYAIIDGLNGDWERVANAINSKRILVISGDSDVVAEAENKGLSALLKGDVSIENIMEMLQ